MRICKVIGQAVSAHKTDRLQGYGLLLCQPLQLESGKWVPAGPQILAIDVVSASPGTIVAVAEGSAALAAVPAPVPPVDAVVVAILDRVETHSA